MPIDFNCIETPDGIPVGFSVSADAAEGGKLTPEAREKLIAVFEKTLEKFPEEQRAESRERFAAMLDRNAETGFGGLAIESHRELMKRKAASLRRDCDHLLSLVKGYESGTLRAPNIDSHAVAISLAMCVGLVGGAAGAIDSTVDILAEVLTPGDGESDGEKGEA